MNWSTAVVCYQAGQTRFWHHVVATAPEDADFQRCVSWTHTWSEGDAVTTTVGAYRLEGSGVHLFDTIEGEHSAILGLPMLALLGSCGSRYSHTMIRLSNYNSSLVAK